MDKFTNSSHSSFHKFHNQSYDTNKLLELQHRLKIEAIVANSINVDNEIKVERVVEEQVVEEQVVEEQVVEEQVVEEQVVEEQKESIQESIQGEIQDSLTVLFDTVYQSNESFTMEKPTTILETIKPTLDQTKLNSLIKLKKW
jgi:hypothetical protein